MTVFSLVEQHSPQNYLGKLRLLSGYSWGLWRSLMSPLAFPLPAVPSNDIDLELANHMTSLRSTENVSLKVDSLSIEYILVIIKPGRFPGPF